MKTQSYLHYYENELKSVPFMPNVKFLGEKKFPSGISLYDYLNLIIEKNPILTKYLNLEKKSPNEWRAIYEELNIVSTLGDGGFGHGSIGQIYGRMQRDMRYCYSRLTGYQAIFNLMMPLANAKSGNLIVDLLAGNGTLTRMFKKLHDKISPMIIGIDISETLIKDSFENGEISFRSKMTDNIFGKEIAEAAICAYGTHHIPEKDRYSFFLSAKELVKKGGKILIHDFEENSSTAKWYSDLIHRYRPGGHPCKHFTEAGMKDILSSLFKKTELTYIYDPFYLEFDREIDNQQVKRNFFSYLIRLFALQKLLPKKDVDYFSLGSYKNEKYWNFIETELTPFFNITDSLLSKCSNKDNLVQYNEGTCIVEKNVIPGTSLRIHELNGKKFLIAPRVGLVGIGYC